ncbi:hypothetical protein FA15DRAFT_419502 [Coprinopsis marcescibilis]|uniref:Uncharacterized protein n=1 Tax=Coprinopsis marcescibilis TaxID=230819 RepID=A0A5C3KVU1_COPMA|nr:hypothetical protein FA15DRAFT_419502 [Coprinopsis marcescibilis]
MLASRPDPRCREQGIPVNIAVFYDFCRPEKWVRSPGFCIIGVRHRYCQDDDLTVAKNGRHWFAAYDVMGEPLIGTKRPVESQALGRCRFRRRTMGSPKREPTGEVDGGLLDVFVILRTLHRFISFAQFILLFPTRSSMINTKLILGILPSILKPGFQ